MFTTFTALALAGGGLRLVLQWQLKRRWQIALSVPQALAGALVVLAGLPEFIKPIPFPIPSFSHPLSHFVILPSSTFTSHPLSHPIILPSRCYARFA